MTSTEAPRQSMVMLYPRQKRTFSSSPPTSSPSAQDGAVRQLVTIDQASVERCFHMPIHDAARHFNICVTSLKKVCRRLGFNKWPYVKPLKHSSNVTATSPSTQTGAVSCPVDAAEASSNLSFFSTTPSENITEFAFSAQPSQPLDSFDAYGNSYSRESEGAPTDNSESTFELYTEVEMDVAFILDFVTSSDE